MTRTVQVDDEIHSVVGTGTGKRTTCGIEWPHFDERVRTAFSPVLGVNKCEEYDWDG